MATVTSELNQRFEELFNLASKHIPARNTEQLVLYPAGHKIEPYIPKPASKSVEAPTYKAGPRKLTIEEYRRRTAKPA